MTPEEFVQSMEVHQRIRAEFERDVAEGRLPELPKPSDTQNSALPGGRADALGDDRKGDVNG